MKKRLQALQERMKQQQLQDEAKGATSGGNKWKSASKEKGSVTHYAKEVQERYRKRSGTHGADPMQRTGGTLPSRTMQTQQKGGFRSKGKGIRMQYVMRKLHMLVSLLRMQPQQYLQISRYRWIDVETWDVSDVSEWLMAMQLQQYVNAFAQNDINGTILLDINLEDLDYMSITVLGHRKAILKGVEDLRRNKRFVEASRGDDTTAHGDAVVGTQHASMASLNSIQRTKSNPQIGGGSVDASSKTTSVNAMVS